MKIKIGHIARKLLLAVIALQLLNISLGTQNIQETDYDYSYSYNKSYDPTETAVEWIVEMQYGQQSGFSYSNHSDNSKNLIRSFHWQTTLRRFVVKIPAIYVIRTVYPERPEQPVLSRAIAPFSPPPEA
jgi:hypothetical protein